MLVFHGPDFEEPRPCSYFPTRTSQFEFLLASDVDESEFDLFLEQGWRKFGSYFFRPHCGGCRACIPIRIQVDAFTPSKSQRRVLRKNCDLHMKVDGLVFREDVYQLYLKHSERFSKNIISDRRGFAQAFLHPSVPGLQTLFFEGDQLVATGFLDISNKGLSSVYFVFDPGQEKRSPGTYGILAEIQMARFLGKAYYYLGYWIEENQSMRYKSRFHPHQLLNWDEGTWQDDLSR